jgi:hypothetical protein
LVHLLTVTVWLGGVVSIFIFALRAFSLDATGFLQLAPEILWVFPRLLLPVGIITLLEGLYYGFLTNWGFFRHKWLLAKWALFFVSGYLIGGGFIAQMQAALLRAQNGTYIGGWPDSGAALLSLAGHVAALTAMYILSVYKPGKAK